MAIGLVALATVLVVPGCRTIDTAEDIVNDAVNSIENESMDWKVVLQRTSDDLRNNDFPQFADRVDLLLQRSIAATGSQVFCLIDRIESHVLQGLARIKTEILGGKPPRRSPTVCLAVPDSLNAADSSRPSAATFYGYDLDADGLRLLHVSLKRMADGTMKEEDEDVTAKMETGTAHYQRIVDLGGAGVELTKWSKALRLIASDGQVLGSILVTQPRCSERDDWALISAITLTPKLESGDREYFGNGPDIDINVRVFPSADGKSLLGNASMRANETNGGDTKAFVSRQWEIRSARSGESIGQVTSRDFDSLSEEAPNQTTAFERPGSGLVRLYQIIGDTAGDDVQSDTDPTSVKISFNVVNFRLNACK